MSVEQTELLAQIEELLAGKRALIGAGGHTALPKGYDDDKIARLRLEVQGGKELSPDDMQAIEVAASLIAQALRELADRVESS